jgi:membrane protease YdiL (CAAX protease family)
MGTLLWNPEDKLLLAGLFWSIIGFGLYYVISKQKGPPNRLSPIFPSAGTQVIQVVLQRTWGMLFLGILPAGVIIFGFKATPAAFGLSFHFLSPPPLWSYALIPLIILMTYFVGSSPANLNHYPQIRLNRWTMGLLWLSAASWVAFLIAYEFMFRGFLLFSSISVLNPAVAIGLNVALYALAHFYKGALEVVGAIPLGIILCYLTMLTGNIWCAVALHSMMALSHEWFSLKAHPQMKLIRK